MNDPQRPSGDLPRSPRPASEADSIFLNDEDAGEKGQGNRPAAPAEQRNSKWIFWLVGTAVGLFVLIGLIVTVGFIFLSNRYGRNWAQDTEQASDATNNDEPVLQAGGNLLKFVDPPKNALRGTWRFDGETLVSPPTGFALLQIPVRPMANYELTATVEASTIHDCLVLGLVVGSRQVTVVCNGWSNTTSGLQLVDLKLVPANETATGPILVAGRPNQIVCTVTDGRVEVSCNGKRVVNWSGDFQRLLAGPDWEPTNLHQLYIGSHQTSYRISRLAYRPLGTTASVNVKPEADLPGRAQ